MGEIPQPEIDWRLGRVNNLRELKQWAVNNDPIINKINKEAFYSHLESGHVEWLIIMALLQRDRETFERMKELVNNQPIVISIPTPPAAKKEDEGMRH